MCIPDIPVAARSRPWLGLTVAAVILCFLPPCQADMGVGEAGFSIPSPPLPRGAILVAVDGSFAIAPPNMPAGPVLSAADAHFAIAPPPPPTGPVLVSGEGGLIVYPQADANRDMCVNVADLLMIRNNLGSSGSNIQPPLADVSPQAPDYVDGIVNVADLLIIRNRLGEGECGGGDE